MQKERKKTDNKGGRGAHRQHRQRFSVVVHFCGRPLTSVRCRADSSRFWGFGGSIGLSEKAEAADARLERLSSHGHPYRVGVQSEPGCSLPSYIHTTRQQHAHVHVCGGGGDWRQWWTFDILDGENEDWGFNREAKGSTWRRRIVGRRGRCIAGDEAGRSGWFHPVGGTEASGTLHSTLAPEGRVVVTT